MDGKAWLSVMAATVCVLAAGCGANRHGIYRHQVIKDGKTSVIVTDAKQRLLLISPETTTDTVDGLKTTTTTTTVSVDGQQKSTSTVTVDQQDRTTQTKANQRFCSEPSPDVFSVVAQAVSASGTFGQRPDPKAIEAGLSAAFSSAEQGSTIPRTQTINLLKELMFRTCERYLGGAYDNLEVKIQAARDQRLIVSILAIESLTGAVTPKPVVIGASAEAGGGSSAGEAVVRLDNAYKDLQIKSAALQSSQLAYNEITENDKKHCEQIADAVAKKEEDKLPQELKDKKAKCESATAALASAKKAASEAASYYATLKEVATGGAPLVSTSTKLMDPKSAGGLDRAHSESIVAVAGVVGEIVRQNMDQDEFLFFCLKLMGDKVDDSMKELAIKNDVVAECFKYISSTLALERSKNEERADVIQAEIQASVSRNRAAVNQQFEKFWGEISDDADPSKVSPAKYSAIKSKAAKLKSYSGFDSAFACFEKAVSKSDFDSCFVAIKSAPLKRELGKLGG